MKILLLRDYYTHFTTSGIMLLNSKYFGYTLEDFTRHTPKIKHETAIPEGLYEVKVTYSPRFKRQMPQILNVPGFTGVRIHGGNTHLNTSGCPLVARSRSLQQTGATIWGSLEKELTKRLKASTGKHWIEIINTRTP